LKKNKEENDAPDVGESSKKLVYRPKNVQPL
jgi:hypothetical protein